MNWIPAVRDSFPFVISTPPRVSNAERRASSGDMPARMLSSMCASRWPFNSSVSSASPLRRPKSPLKRVNHALIPAMTPSMICAYLLRAQRDQRIHGGRAACGQPARDERHAKQCQRGGGEHSRIAGTDAVEQRRDKPAAGERDTEPRRQCPQAPRHHPAARSCPRRLRAPRRERA